MTRGWFSTKDSILSGGYLVWMGVHALRSAISKVQGVTGHEGYLDQSQLKENDEKLGILLKNSNSVYLFCLLREHTPVNSREKGQGTW